MKPFDIPLSYQITHGVQRSFEKLKSSLGRLPALYAVMGYSPAALDGFMALDEALSRGVFTRKEREAIAIIVSQVNDCQYCLAWHTAEALKVGLTMDEIKSIRLDQVKDRKLNAIVKLAKSMVESQGHPEESLQLRFYMAGFQESGAVELAGLVSLWIFSNYLYALTPVAIDFPMSNLD